MKPDVIMATQNFKRNLLLNLYREGKKKSLLCFLLLLKRDKNIWHLQAISSIWRPLAFLPVTLSLLFLKRYLSYLNSFQPKRMEKKKRKEILARCSLFFFFFFFTTQSMLYLSEERVCSHHMRSKSDDYTWQRMEEK